MTNEEIFNENIKLAYKITQQYKHSGIEYEDLKQMCLLALWKSVLTYKNNKGWAFSTYAYRVIQNELNHYLRINKKYLTDRFFSEEISENFTLEDILADDSDKIDELEDRLDIERFMNIIENAKLTERERRIVDLSLKRL